MAQAHISGQQGEAMAQKYLLEHGYAILETNWKCGKNEADIIAYHEGVIVFVEVKTRAFGGLASPEEAVDRKKRQIYIKLANAYVLANQREEEVRFDIIAIELGPQGYEIRHIPDAFNAIGQTWSPRNN